MRQIVETMVNYITLTAIVFLVIWAALIFLGCTPPPPSGPTTVSTTVVVGAADDTSKKSPMAGTITLEPSSLTVGVGKTRFVRVIVKNSLGVEQPSVNITVAIADMDALRFDGADGRTLSFYGRSVGDADFVDTEAVITASELQASLPVRVTE